MFYSYHIVIILLLTCLVGSRSASRKVIVIGSVNADIYMSTERFPEDSENTVAKGNENSGKNSLVGKEPSKLLHVHDWAVPAIL